MKIKYLLKQPGGVPACPHSKLSLSLAMICLKPKPGCLESRIHPNWVTGKTQSDGGGTSRLVDRVRPLSFRSAPHTDSRSHCSHTHTRTHCDTPGSHHLRRRGEMREQALLIVCPFLLLQCVKRNERESAAPCSHAAGSPQPRHTGAL